MAVSDDLRERVVEAVVLGGLSRNQAAARFKVSVASAVRWVKRFRNHGRNFTGLLAATTAPAGSRRITTISWAWSGAAPTSRCSRSGSG